MKEHRASIAEGINRVLERVKHWMQDNNQICDRLFLVGGFCQFYLVQKTILEALQLEENSTEIDRTFNLINSAFAISYGACLIANGLVSPTEIFVHSLGIVIDTINNNAEVEPTLISIIEGGTNLDDLASVRFADIPPLTTFKTNEPLTVTLWVDPQSRGKIFKEHLPNTVKLPQPSTDDKWRVGMRVNRSQVAYLVIEAVGKDKRTEYELGNVIAKMFPGFILFEEDDVN
jgi:molecular chaperone DnaK